MPKIDTAWIEWIALNKIRGVSVATILLAMTKAGFDEQDSLRVISSAEKLPLYELFRKSEEERLSLQKQLLSLQTPAATLTVPTPVLTTDQLFGTIGGQAIYVGCRMTSPDICVVYNFLSEEEIKTILAIADKKLQPSKVVDHKTGDSVDHANRTSSGMAFTRGENPTITNIENRISQFVQWPVDRGEGIQVLKYGIGQQYTPHYDYFIPDQPSAAVCTKNGGQRRATLIMYLSTPEEGGFTEFPNLNLRIPAVAGSALFFSYPDDTKTETLHAGTPVVKGTKYIATKWLRERTYD